MISGHTSLEAVIGAMLAERQAQWYVFTRLHLEMLRVAHADKIGHFCNRSRAVTGKRASCFCTRSWLAAG